MIMHGGLRLTLAVLVAATAFAMSSSSPGQVQPPPQAEAATPVERLTRIAEDQDDKELVRALKRVLKDPGGHYGYQEAVERAYNLGERALAFDLIDIGETLAVPAERRAFLRMRRAIWRYEGDVDAVEKSFAGPLEGWIADPDAPFPDDLTRDPVMMKRFRPRLMEAYAVNPAHEPLFELLRRTLGAEHDDASLERVLRLRLTVDVRVLPALTWLLRQGGRHEEILALGRELAPRTTDTVQYRLARAEALTALGRKKEALAAADALAAETAKNGYYWNRIAEIYIAFGLKDKAIDFIKQRARPGNADAAKLLARCGDAEGVRAVVQQAIDRGSPAWVLMECRDAVRAIGDEALAERVFDAAEKLAIERVRRSPNPAFDFRGEVRYRYEQEGRLLRLADALLPLYPEEKRPEFLANFAGGLIGDKMTQGIKIMEKYHDKYGEDETFSKAYEGLVRRSVAARQPRQAPVAPPPPPPPPPDPKLVAVEIAQLRAAVTRLPNSPRLHAELGLRLIRTGDVRAGRAEIRRAVALGEEFSLVRPLRFMPSCREALGPGPWYWEVRNAYLDRGLRNEMEADLALLLGRTRAHRAQHLVWVARWLGEHGRKAQATALQKEADRENPYRTVHVWK